MFSFERLFLLALAGVHQVVSTELTGSGTDHNALVRNYIMVIPDGFGPASEKMAREYVHWKNNATEVLPVDEMVIGQIRTKSTDNLVTDSAAGATAYSCGIKTYNGAIGVADDRLPCATVLEAAKRKGYKTGLVATSRITHATPGSYAAHTVHRDFEDTIAAQQIGYTHPLGPTVDILMGGGRCHYLPKPHPDSCREDSVDLLEFARSKGYTVFDNRTVFDKQTKLPYLGLFTPNHMTYEVDRDPAKEPSLKEMALKAVNDLYGASKDQSKGFFIMVEASRIDHAGHVNDAVAHLHEVLEYNNVMKALREWIDAHPDSSTTLISTADHETGGLTIGQEIITPTDWYDEYDPSHFNGAVATAATLASKWKSYAGGQNETFLREEVFAKYGVAKPSGEEIAEGIKLKGQSEFEKYLKNALDTRLRIGWSTLGHTGVDVTLYGWGATSKQFVGNHDNSEVGRFAAKQLGLNLSALTAELRTHTSWISESVDVGGAEQKLAGRSLTRHHN